MMAPDSHLMVKQPRYLRQPGRFNPVRIQSVASPFGRHIRLLLKPGESLYDAVVKPLDALNIRDASTTILGGIFEQLHYCVAIPDPDKRTVIAYSKPRFAGWGVYMVFGNATLGRSIEGKPLVHCHAVVRTETGEVKGGHIITESAIVGPRPISVLVTSLEGLELCQALDEETGIPLFQPVEARRHE
jgi:predicted DNA-binding protein with PD1-like motif